MARPLGHRNLAIRGGIALFHGCLTLTMVSFGIAASYHTSIASCQFVSAATLFVQWWTANPLMFIARASMSFIRSIIMWYCVVCGVRWEAEECVSDVWFDARWKFRVPALMVAFLVFLNGLSLTFQFLYPRRGVGIRGNEQLFYRGCVRACALPVHFFNAMMKLGDLAGTPLERPDIEVVIHFIRGLFLAPAAAWSLWNQWVMTGSGKRTDDYRTSFEGEEEPDALSTMADYIDRHKGHRNLIFRCILSIGQGTLTCCLVAYSIDTFHNVPVALCQFTGAVALFIQWQFKHSSMFLVRAISNWIRVGLLLHLSVCGRSSSYEDCDTDGWHDVRRPFRFMNILAVVRMFAIGASLVLEWSFPDHGVTEWYGNAHLFYRSCLRAIGMPLYIARGVSESALFFGTNFERTKLEVAVDFLRACYFIPLQSISLYEQWLNSGHPGSAEEQKGLLEMTDTGSEWADSDEDATGISSSAQ